MKASQNHSQIQHTCFIVLIIQVISPLFFGVGFSKGSPLAPWAPSGHIVLVLNVVAIILFPIIGTIGLFVGKRSLKKGQTSLITNLLIVLSICYLLYFPMAFVSHKIAGIFNYQWTTNAKQQRESVEFFRHKTELQYLQ
jgi:hypothetical protein